MENNNKRLADIFGNNPNISLEERNRVIAELQKIGSLTFKVKKDEDGWIANCSEINGLIAGSNNPNPSDFEVESQVREAVYSAFNVKFERFPSPIMIELSAQS